MTLQLDSPLQILPAYFDWGIVQHVGPNRSGKTLEMALEAWKAYRRGLDVWCNCPKNPFYENEREYDSSAKEYQCILNFPHYHYNPGHELLRLNLRYCFILTDQAEQFMDATAPTVAVRNMGYFAYQAKKRTLRWDYDTVRAKNIYNRVRLNPDWIIYSKRYPHNWRQPLEAVKYTLTTDERGDGEVQERVRWLVHPIERGFGRLYNDVIMVRPFD